MASKKIKWSSDGILNHSKTGTVFYSYFSTVCKDEGTKLYNVGECLLIKTSRRIAVMIAEIMDIWVEESNDDDDDNSHERVKIRLYACPEDTPNGRNHTHGEHELVMFYKHVVLTCHQFLSMEQADFKWDYGIPLQPPTAIDPPLSLPVSPVSSSTHSMSSLLYCYEPMVPVGLFEYEEYTGVSPCASPIASRLQSVIHSQSIKIRVVSYPVYCRYRSILARFGDNSTAYQYMSNPLVQYIGGIPIPDTNTILMYCRAVFRDITLERKLNFCISKDIIFSSTTASTRRGSSSLSPSPPSTTSSDATTRGRGRPPKRKRGRPRKEEITSDGSSPIKIPIDCESIFPVNKKIKKIDNGHHEEIAMIIPSSLNNNINASSSSSNNDIITNGVHSTLALQPSDTSLVDSDIIIHGLRPRSSLLLPTQFRGESYDMENEQLNNEDRIPHPPNTTDQTHNVHVSSVSPMKIGSNVIVTKLPPVPAQQPVVFKSSKSLTPSDITQDVKELLKAYLSCLQATITSETVSNDAAASLETHLINERLFLDLLFCFMKMRKTPIHRVPRLGSRNLNLFELYKATTMLGGYEQVTINRKWSQVFDSIGCATGMTCASTVTRKHYEKLLLPFERALAALKN